MVRRDELERRLLLPYQLPAPDGRRRARWFALGDPQTSFDRLVEILARADLLDDAGRLRLEVGLLSIGDHFDYGTVGGPEMGREGHLFLRWLADHPPDQIVILAGNHDLARVQELAHESDASFAEARALGLALRARESEPEPDEAAIAELRATFARRHPHLPTPEIAARDYAGFSEAQRAFVQELLATSRLRLGFAGRRDGEPVLFTHAAVTTRDLASLEIVVDADATSVERALQTWLERSVAAVLPSWRAGTLAPLDLAPLQVMGTAGREGGGLLHHRPASPERPGADVRWELDPRAPRRFDPRTLPLGLRQVCGHSGHKKCLKELDAWVTPRARAQALGGQRTLRTDGTAVEYDLGVHPARPDEATVWFIDGEIHSVPIEAYELLPFDGPWTATV